MMGYRSGIVRTVAPRAVSNHGRSARSPPTECRLADAEPQRRPRGTSAVGDSGLRPYFMRSPAAIARVMATGLVPIETRVRSSRSNDTEGSPASILAMRD